MAIGNLNFGSYKLATDTGNVCPRSLPVGFTDGLYVVKGGTTISVTFVFA
jgi:hypothetical protein